MSAPTWWLVYSPTNWREFNDYDEPPEPYAYAVEVLAPTRRAAIVAAVRHPDMVEWCAEARGDNRPPFAGLSAMHLGENE